MFKDKDELQKAIDKYYKRCDENTKTVIVKNEVVTIPDPIPYTIEGLANVLECDRLTLLNYETLEGYEEYFNTVKKAKRKVLQNKIERGLMGSLNPIVTIFDLKNNHGFKDKSEIQHDGNVTHTFQDVKRLLGESVQEVKELPEKQVIEGEIVSE